MKCFRLVDTRARQLALRGDVLCLRIRSIGEAAGLEVNGEGTGFRRARESALAPLMRRTLEAAE
jgi:hypothetical protein